MPARRQFYSSKTHYNNNAFNLHQMNYVNHYHFMQIPSATLWYTAVTCKQRISTSNCEK